MYNYFLIPWNISDSDICEAERNPKFCDNLKSLSISSSETKLEIVERDYKFPSFTDKEIKSEKWVKIEEGQDLEYYLSNLGRIYSVCSNRILKPMLGPRAKEISNSPQVRICGFPKLASGSWEEQNGSKRYEISCLMRKYFFGIPDAKNEDCQNEYYVIHKNNNVFDNRKSNLLVTRNLTLLNIIRFNKRMEEESKYKKGGIFLVRESFVERFLNKIEKKKTSSISILHKEDYFVILTSPDEESLKQHLLVKCPNDLSKSYLEECFKIVPDSSLCNSEKGFRLVTEIRNKVLNECAFSNL